MTIDRDTRRNKLKVPAASLSSSPKKSASPPPAPEARKEYPPDLTLPTVSPPPPNGLGDMLSPAAWPSSPASRLNKAALGGGRDLDLDQYQHMLFDKVSSPRASWRQEEYA